MVIRNSLLNRENFPVLREMRRPLAPAPPRADFAGMDFLPSRIADRVLFRDGLAIILDKPSGIPVHSGPAGGPHLEHWFPLLRFGLPRPPALAHRLDRDTSGCLVLGRHPKALRRLGRLFSEGKEKTMGLDCRGRSAFARMLIIYAVVRVSTSVSAVVVLTGRAKAASSALAGKPLTSFEARRRSRNAERFADEHPIWSMNRRGARQINPLGHQTRPVEIRGGEQEDGLLSAKRDAPASRAAARRRPERWLGPP